MVGSPKKNKIQIPEYGSEEYQKWLDAGIDLGSVDSNTEFLYSYFSHSGFNFRYNHHPQKIFYPTGGVRLGFLGGLKLTEKDTFLGLFNNTVYQVDVMSFTPEVGVGVNMLHWCRFNFDIGYRMIMSEDSTIASSQNYNNPTFTIGIAFGKFNQ